MLKRTPLYECHEEAGARFVPFAGYEMPVQYAGVKGEHLCVRQGVGLFDVSHMGEVRVTGPKATEAVSGLVSNVVSDMTVGQARYTVMCNERGGMVDDLVVYRVGENEWLICVNAANRDKDFAWMVEHNPFPQEATFTDESDAWVQIAVQGRHAEATLQPLTSHTLSELVYYHFADGLTVADVPGCIIARTGYTGEDGFEVFVPAAEGPKVWRALMKSGEAHGVQPIGLGARDTLRLEVRYPLYGHELSDDTSPRQARLMWVTKLGKEGGFIGAEAIAERKATDDTFLCGVVLEGKRIAREGMTVLVDGEPVGTVTSGTKSPSLGTAIALCYVKRPHHKIGTQLTIDVRGREAVGTVVKGPFYTRDY